MSIESVPAKKFMTPTRLGDAAFTCNPYRGCTHGCQYCYVKTLPGTREETRPWGSYVEHRAFVDYAIPRGTGSKKLLFSSATDAYQPIEKIVRETRKVLESIVESDLDVSILTKSDLALRDLDLFLRMKRVEVGFSIACEDEDAAWLEPGATLPSKRWEALKTLHQAGVRTYAFVAPILPGITNVEAWIERLRDCTDYLMFDTLNLSQPENKTLMFRLIEAHRPDLIPLWTDTFDRRGPFYARTKALILSRTQRSNHPIGHLY